MDEGEFADDAELLGIGLFEGEAEVPSSRAFAFRPRAGGAEEDADACAFDADQRGFSDGHGFFRADAHAAGGEVEDGAGVAPEAFDDHAPTASQAPIGSPSFAHSSSSSSSRAKHHRPGGGVVWWGKGTAKWEAGGRIGSTVARVTAGPSGP